MHGNIPQRSSEQKRKRRSDKCRPVSRRRYEYSAGAVLKRLAVLGVTSIDQIEDEHVEWFRENTTDLSPVTVESYLKGLGILLGKKFGGSPLAFPDKSPETVSLSDLSAVYEQTRIVKHPWMRRYLKFAYITGLRVGDLINLKRSDVKDDVIEVVAQKTGKLQRFPRHYLLMPNLANTEWVIGHLHGGVQKRRQAQTIRKRLRYFCDKAGVPHFTPHMIRKTAATEYEKAHPGSGAILLGHAHSSITLKHYIDPCEILRTAQLSLAIPESMMTRSYRVQRDREDEKLLAAFSKLSDVERKALISTISRSGRRY